MNHGTRLSVLVALPLALTLLVACGDDDDTNEPAPTTVTTEAETTSSQAPPTGDSAPSTPPTTSGSAPTTQPPDPAPEPDPALGFVTASADYPVTCVTGTSVSPTLTWDAPDATAMALSVDNPGLVGAYGTYPATGSEAMPDIGCIGEPGTVLTHVYDLHTVGTDPVDHKTITVNITVLAV